MINHTSHKISEIINIVQWSNSRRKEYNKRSDCVYRGKFAKKSNIATDLLSSTVKLAFANIIQVYIGKLFKESPRNVFFKDKDTGRIVQIIFLWIVMICRCYIVSVIWWHQIFSEGFPVLFKWLNRFCITLYNNFRTQIFLQLKLCL